MLNYIYSRLVEINGFINKATEEFEPEIRPIIRYSLESGQRLRPLLLIAGYELSGKDARDNRDIIKISASLEFLHKASLAHDDIVDEDEYRRGEKSIPGKFGVKKGIIIGDLLIATAYRLIYSSLKEFSCEKSSQSMELFNEIFFRLSRGELFDLLYEKQPGTGKYDCTKLIEDKTGIFIQNALLMGGLLGDCQYIDALRKYGFNLGLAFQFINDLNNFNGLERVLKRTFASDIKMKRNNIIIEKALEYDDCRREIMKVMYENIGNRDIDYIVTILFKYGIIEIIRNDINLLLRECSEIARSLPDCPVKSLMKYIPLNAYNKMFWKNKSLAGIEVAVN